MNFNIKNGLRAMLVIAFAAMSLSCSNEFTQSAAPVELVITHMQNLQLIDLAGNASGQTECDEDITEIEIRSILKAPNADVDQRFNDVRITRYRVSYVRTDGGTLVPAPFVRSVDFLVPSGGAPEAFGDILLFQSDAVLQQPFAALRTQNGGRDPETGRRVVGMDVVLDFFGETLAGANVAGRTRIPLDFCFDCGGCS